MAWCAELRFACGKAMSVDVVAASKTHHGSYALIPSF